MTAPSIKEALANIAALSACVAVVDNPKSHIEMLSKINAVSVDALKALATLQPDGERREAIARLIKDHVDYIVSNKSALEVADAILASGLVQDEAGILRVMEQECWTLRCVDIPTDCGDADVGWEVIQHHQAKPYERMIAHGRTPQEALAAAIRSARDGGAES